MHECIRERQCISDLPAPPPGLPVVERNPAAPLLVQVDEALVQTAPGLPAEDLCVAELFPAQTKARRGRVLSFRTVS